MNKPTLVGCSICWVSGLTQLNQPCICGSLNKRLNQLNQPTELSSRVANLEAQVKYLMRRIEKGIK